jgi:DNA-binding LytR/AlgR family response regulator
VIPRILICDDSQIQRVLVQEFIEEMGEEIQFDEACTGQEAIQKSKEVQYDIILMDIHMGSISGLKAAKQIRIQHPFVFIIFITAYDHYAMEALREVHCFDYIKKPLKKAEIHQLLKILIPKVREDLYKDSLFQQMEADTVKYLTIPTGQGQTVIEMDMILFVERKGKFCAIHTLSKIYFVDGALEQILEQLSDRFLRCHKSYIVNVTKIEKIQAYTRYTDTIIFMGYRVSAKSSARKKKELKQYVNKYNYSVAF